MIIVNDKNIENTVNFPKNLYNIQNDSDIALSSYNVVLKNRATNKTYEYNILDDLYKFSHDFYSFNLDFSKLPDDEYEYKILKNIYKYIQQKYDLNLYYYYVLNINIGDKAPTKRTTNSNYCCRRIEVKAGQKIELKTIGAGTAKPYALTDEDLIVYDIAEELNYEDGITLMVKKDGYLYVNSRRPDYDKFDLTINIPTIEDDVYVASGIIKIKDGGYYIINYKTDNFDIGAYYNMMVNGGIGYTAPTTTNLNNDFACILIQVKKNDEIFIKTYGSSNARAYTLTDKDRIIYEISEPNINYSSGVNITAVKDGYLYVNDIYNRFDSPEVKIIKYSIPPFSYKYYGTNNFEQLKYYDNHTVGAVIRGPFNSEVYQSIIIPIQKNDEVTIYTCGRENARAYALTDENKIVYEVAPTDSDYSNGFSIENIMMDGYLCVNNDNRRFNYPSIKIKRQRTSTYYDKNREYITYDKQNN